MLHVNNKNQTINSHDFIRKAKYYRPIVFNSHKNVFWLQKFIDDLGALQNSPTTKNRKCCQHACLRDGNYFLIKLGNFEDAPGGEEGL